MTKQEQIEEIAKDIHRVCTACSGEMFDEYTCDRCQAKLLIKKGYRRLPDGAVVLLIGENNQALDEKTIEYFVKHNEQIRKEAVKEFAEKLKECAKSCEESGYDGIGEDDIDLILKEYEEL